MAFNTQCAMTLCADYLLEWSDELEQDIQSIYDTISLSDSVAIGQYGHLDLDLKVDAVSLSSANPMKSASRLIQDIIKALKNADPRVLVSRPGFIHRYFGMDAILRINYFDGIDSANRLLNEIPGAIREIESLGNTLQSLHEQYGKDLCRLKLYLVAGRLFDETFKGSAQNDIERDNRVRFQNRLANLERVLQSHMMAATDVSRNQIILNSIVDRLREVSHTLIPTWRNHHVNCELGQLQEAPIFEQALKAHGTLLNTLIEIGR